MDYLTNEKLISMRHHKQTLSFANSRSNSVSRIQVPSVRNTHDSKMELLNKISRLDDILRVKKDQGHRSTNLGSVGDRDQSSEYRVLQNIDANCYKSPPQGQKFLNVYTAVPKVNTRRVLDEEKEQMKKESLRKFKDEFNSMQQKIRSRNNSAADINMDPDQTLKKLVTQLQLQCSNLSERLLFEQTQNQKYTKLIENLNSQIAALNSEVNSLQTQRVDQSKSREELIQKQQQQLSILQFQCKQSEVKLLEQSNQLQQYEQLESNMKELEQLCNMMGEIQPQITIQQQMVLEIQELLRVQQNIIDKIIHKRDFPMDQLIYHKKSQRVKSQSIEEKCLECTNSLALISKQLKSQLDILTERFIHDLLI